MLLIGSQEYVVVLLHSFFGPLIVLKRTLGGTANGALKSLRLSGVTWPHTLNLRSVSPTKAKKKNSRQFHEVNFRNDLLLRSLLYSSRAPKLEAKVTLRVRRRKPPIRVQLLKS